MFVGKVIFLLLSILFRFVIVFLPRSKCLYISWLVAPSAVICESKKISVIASTFSPSICHEVVGTDAMILVFWMLSFKPAFSLSPFTFIKRLFGASSLQLLKWYPLHIGGCWYFWASLTVNSSKRVLLKVNSSIKCLIRRNEDLRHYKMYKYREGDIRAVAQTLLFLFCK